MTFKTDGIIIREGATGEQDRIVTVLTRDRGVIKAFANGARNPKNKNVSSTGLLCYSDFLINKTQKGIYVIREAIAKEVFFSLRSDIVRLSLAQYFAELTYELSPREENSGEYLSLLLNSIYLLSQGKRNLRQIKAVLEMRMLSIAGYMPSIVACASCGSFESETMFFSTVTGELFCEECKPLEKTVKLPLGVVTAIRHICFSESGKIFSFSLPEERITLLSDVTEKYLRNITARRYKTLDFFNMMSD
ncbi:MAG: DNA repair protein RecO [Clostridia bacterium]|nr:DNA repair protein RecO [Clostridia bacterium]